MSRAVRSAALAAALCCSAGNARAHAPLPRGLVVAPNDSGSLAVRMPGFGWIVRTASGFAYACDALIGVSPYDDLVPMAYRQDGALLVGTAHGIRKLSSDGCPTSTASLDAPITALAVHASRPQRAYAITGGAGAAISTYRSDDSGESWTLAGPLATYPVTALVLDPNDPQKLYVSQTTGMQRSQIAVSSDGGASYATFEQGRDLTLVYVQSTPARLWARTRVVGQPYGVLILRAERPEGPWQELLSVKFFGGLVVSPDDANVIWVGDEAGGVYRSIDGGDTFDETQPDVAAACLAYGAGALWVCTPDLPTKPALARSPDGVEKLEPVMAFADVDHMVDCSPTIDVEKVCAPAWVEWRRDILGVPPVVLDAGAADAGSGAAADAGAQGAAPRAKSRAVPMQRKGPGCSVYAVHAPTSAEWQWLCVVAGLFALRTALSERSSYRYPSACRLNSRA